MYKINTPPKLTEFHGGVKASDGNKYFNCRAECWGLLLDWLKSGAEIPNDPELETDLTSPEYLYSPKQQIQLEKKETMKNRGLASPDTGDCLAMTFAVNVAAARTKPSRRTLVYPGSEGEQGWMA